MIEVVEQGEARGHLAPCLAIETYNGAPVGYWVGVRDLDDPGPDVGFAVGSPLKFFHHGDVERARDRYWWITNLGPRQSPGP
jgi:hypothetical protein